MGIEGRGSYLHSHTSSAKGRYSFNFIDTQVLLFLLLLQLNYENRIEINGKFKANGAENRRNKPSLPLVERNHAFYICRTRLELVNCILESDTAWLSCFDGKNLE